MKLFLPILTLMFVAAKLTGHIDWSWWLVFLPMYPAIILWVIFTVIFALVGGVAATRRRF